MAKPVKWAIGSEEPEDLPGFKSNEEIGKPPRGVYTFQITQIQKVVTKAGDDRLLVTCVIAEKDKDRKKWNGYTIWEGFMFMPQSLPFLKRFLKSIGVTWKEFAEKSLAEDDGTITKIGKLNFRGKTPILVRAATKDDDYNGQDRLSITSFLAPPEDADEEDEEEVDDADEEIEEVETEEAEEDDEEPWTREDLEDTELFTLKDLKAECAKLEIDEDEYKSVRKRSTLVDLILSAQETDEDEEEEDEEEEEEEDEGEDLESLTEAQLKARAKELGAGPRDLKKAKTKAALIELVEELLEEEDEDEDGDEPPF